MCQYLKDSTAEHQIKEHVDLKSDAKVLLLRNMHNRKL